MTGRPPAAVLDAFGVAGERPALLEGGMGVTWRAGDVVLKPADDLDAHAWACELQHGWTATDVRVPTPLRAAGGTWSHQGWGGHVWAVGSTARVGDDPDRFRAAAEALHRELARVAPPAFLARRTDAWARAERITFEGAEPVGSPEVVALLRRALAALAPVDTPAQLVHGDLGGNLLVDGDRAPTVIDLSLYHRPVGWAMAVVAMDAVCWEGADPALLDRWSDLAAWDQMLLRAVVFRLATRGVGETLGWRSPGSDGYVADGGASLDLVLARIEAGR